MTYLIMDGVYLISKKPIISVVNFLTFQHTSSRLGKSGSTSQLSSSSTRENSGKKKTPSYMQHPHSSSAPTNPSARTTKQRKNTDKTR